VFDDESEGLCVVERGGGYAQILSLRSQFCEFGSAMAAVLFFWNIRRGKNRITELMRGKDCIYKCSRDTIGLVA